MITAKNIEMFKKAEDGMDWLTDPKAYGSKQTEVKPEEKIDTTVKGFNDRNKTPMGKGIVAKSYGTDKDLKQKTDLARADRDQQRREQFGHLDKQVTDEQHMQAVDRKMNTAPKNQIEKPRAVAPRRQQATTTPKIIDEAGSWLGNAANRVLGMGSSGKPSSTQQATDPLRPGTGVGDAMLLAANSAKKPSGGNEEKPSVGTAVGRLADAAGVGGIGRILGSAVKGAVNGQTAPPPATTPITPQQVAEKKNAPPPTSWFDDYRRKNEQSKRDESYGQVNQGGFFDKYKKEKETNELIANNQKDLTPQQQEALKIRTRNLLDQGKKPEDINPQILSDEYYRFNQEMKKDRYKPIPTGTKIPSVPGLTEPVDLRPQDNTANTLRDQNTITTAGKAGVHFPSLMTAAPDKGKKRYAPINNEPNWRIEESDGKQYVVPSEERVKEIDAIDSNISANLPWITDPKLISGLKESVRPMSDTLKKQRMTVQQFSDYQTQKMNEARSGKLPYLKQEYNSWVQEYGVDAANKMLEEREAANQVEAKRYKGRSFAM